MPCRESQCAKCPFSNGQRLCRNEEGKAPPFCATVCDAKVLERAKDLYQKEPVMHFAAEAARQEVSSGIRREDGSIVETKPRIVETVEFCRRMGYRHLGLAFCGAVHREARIVSEILETNGFQVTSVMCKAGGVDKSFLGLTLEEKRQPVAHESMCNPIGQAEILNEAGTEFNLVMGLCVGHDSLFLKYSRAMCTVFAVKDRLMGHNPLMPIYLYDSCYKYLKKPLP